ncbi:phosphoacetylglucosamine mutase-like isoform X2 [Amphibalanus amphitrite]|nr:phosphoacetylglucosamine mutase-like isoform X2 [Amphibalanus amphitrite]XP_043216072.1 phosphoacetylglucosamine mutase-like isoform X2 [Amphibalanus amphitrite]XP_043216073.1 phosphoacetylglucosamine mutase-like isoform X2 [Amphibalanus amphitrite]XP_043216074.1 phosphoacetylglucosamine mutase-like isoform X2 [Amphibalanus amphitrite]XP_043216075.1 phosphoacetylglucosamine mutase-like isoform X2 [Amphibalanus amphitrite]XP_043216076.1 phosphoacetylglucosamine mutase-like isoform X2 [Amphib
MSVEELYSQATSVALKQHPKQTDKEIRYGTAGFRTKADMLDSIMYRMGLLAVLRSKIKQGASIGVMITASHNPQPDNGVKLVDPQGEMLEAAWEAIATDLVNVSDAELGQKLKSIVESKGIQWSNPAHTVVGRDTRPSSPALLRAVLDGIAALKGEVVDLGIVSTPIVHYVVTCINSNGAYGQASEEGYYKKLTDAFKKLRPEPTNGNYQPAVKFDGANGVGAIMMRRFIELLGPSLRVEMYNESGELNHQCGADFVKVQQRPAEGMTLAPHARCVSVDGDADRIIYFYVDDNEKFHMLDGDRIATLVAGYLRELLEASGLQLDLGLVQTAYANGSSTKYITEQLHVPVACTPTGVKHLHHRAVDFDIGVYFEANGHGTVVFSSAAQRKIAEAGADPSLSESQRAAAGRLRDVMDVINQTVGDAISDMLLVETVLHARGWSIADWSAAYSDLPNRQLKVSVKDRTVVTTTDAERRCVTPDGLQAEIDTLVSKQPQGRAFVRPSGTEDVVRVYAEAETRTAADQLAYQVAEVLYRYAGGVGPKPTPPQ